MAIVNGSHVASHEGNPKNAYSTPQEPSGSLEGLSFEDVTPIIGREFPTVNVVDDILNAPNADERLRDLAITSMCLVPTLTSIPGPDSDQYLSEA
jgi:hypothetical protein